MNEFTIKVDWSAPGSEAPAIAHTTGDLTISLDGLMLTENQDAWSQSIRGSVLVSAYPLATWFAINWWRLNYEPMPTRGTTPAQGWRSAHEMGAANQGYVWPQVVFACDGDAIQIWAAPSHAETRQSVRYLNGLVSPRAVTLDSFRRTVGDFIETTIGRLAARDLQGSDLESIWRAVSEDLADPTAAQIRRLEAQLGFDPEECPDEVLAQALSLVRTMGDSSWGELAPVFGAGSGQIRLDRLEQLVNAEGIRASPASELRSSLVPGSSRLAPWQRGAQEARALRAKLGIAADPIDDETLCGLMGIQSQSPQTETRSAREVTLAVPIDGEAHAFNYLPRKYSVNGRRFENARVVGDLLMFHRKNSPWLTSTDLSTARQKAQRAFAAEFLCPIAGLTEFLGGDFSEEALDEAADHFQVSARAVESLLESNGYLSPGPAQPYLPYAG